MGGILSRPLLVMHVNNGQDAFLLISSRLLDRERMMFNGQIQSHFHCICCGLSRKEPCVWTAKRAPGRITLQMLSLSTCLWQLPCMTRRICVCSRRTHSF